MTLGWRGRLISKEAKREIGNSNASKGKTETEDLEGMSQYIERKYINRRELPWLCRRWVR